MEVRRRVDEKTAQARDLSSDNTEFLKLRLDHPLDVGHFERHNDGDHDDDIEDDHDDDGQVNHH